MSIAPAWHDYFGLLGAAAATLLGLLFVSVSLNAELILGPSHKLAMRLAEQAFHNYITTLLISLCVFFPGLANQDLGLVILIVSGIYALWLLLRFARTMAAPLALDARMRALRRYGSTLAGFVCLAIGGQQMLRDNAPHVLAPLGAALLLISAIAISWELLVKVAETKYGAKK